MKRKISIIKIPEITNNISDAFIIRNYFSEKQLKKLIDIPIKKYVKQTFWYFF